MRPLLEQVNRLRATSESHMCMGMHLEGVNLQLRRLLGTAEQRLAESPETAHKATCTGSSRRRRRRSGCKHAWRRGRGAWAREKGLCRASLATEQDRRDLCWATFTTEHDRRDSAGLR